MARAVTGRVERIYPNPEGARVRLSGIPADDTPSDRYFLLEIGHPNYNALYSLTLVAAVNNYNLTIRIQGPSDVDIDPSVPSPPVQYMYIDF